jgi:hypothetical protein
MTVTRIWHALGLRPHRSDTFKRSPDALLLENVRDTVGLFMNPHDRALFLCVDEKTQIRGLDRIALAALGYQYANHKSTLQAQRAHKKFGQYSNLWPGRSLYALDLPGHREMTRSVGGNHVIE